MADWHAEHGALVGHLDEWAVALVWLCAGLSCWDVRELKA